MEQPRSVLESAGRETPEESKYGARCKEALVGAVIRQPGRNWWPHDLISEVLAPGESPQVLGIYLNELVDQGVLVRDGLTRKIMLAD